MKNSIILGIALVTMSTLGMSAKTNSGTENDLNLMKIDSFKVKGTVDKTFYLSNDAAILNPEALISADYSKTVEEVIAADQQITEQFLSNDGLPAFKSKSIEEIIAADNQIIEAIIPEVQALKCNTPCTIIHAPATAAKL